MSELASLIIVIVTFLIAVAILAAAFEEHCRANGDDWWKPWRFLRSSGSSEGKG